MNTLVLLMAVSCTPAAGQTPVMETRPYAVPASVSAASQEFTGAPQESRPRFFARLRGLFSRKPRTVEGPSAEMSGYSQGIPVNGAISPMASPGMPMGDANSMIFRPQPTAMPVGNSTMQRMPTGQPF